MNYLKRNQLLIAEIGQNLRLERGQPVVDTGITKFTPLGNYQSEVLNGTDLYVGLKESTTTGTGFGVRMALARELSFIRAIADRYPHLSQELPSFYGAIKDGEGTHIGILVEDFSQSGKYRVDEASETDIPKELRDMFDNPQVGDFEMSRACFSVNGQRKIGDFNTMVWWMPHNELDKRFPFHEMWGELEKHTLQIDYPL